MMVIQESKLVEVQLQFNAAETLINPEPPAARNELLAGEIELTQEAPACVTVKVCPAMVIVPTRIAPVALAATE